ncbi:MAG: undecaprenyl/decaprenyl-phosphate alpha-N-acetylglucosaminyl 1-phosphate transferase [Planctomycetes bacterium]|nr:undecaprenyl/decaprenyl-phosphate alpha-N-acetylglucosaminyl 1-phosphate transferase [Planctomycetota bacterium]
MKTYLLVYLGSALLTLLITPVVIWLAHRLSIADVPGARHMHTKPISHIGGVAIFLSMMSLTICVLFLSNVIGDAFRNILPKVIVLLSAATFIFFTGLIDDIKTNGLRARIKLLAQMVAAIAVCTVGIRIKSVVVIDWFTLDFDWFSWPLTLLWIVGITNAVNLSDGLDGLAAGISAVACVVIAIFAIDSSQVVMAVLMFAMLGSLTGFLPFNFNPAKIFMGDCGSMFLGFTIASSSVLCSTKSPVLVGLALPVLALGIPIFDTLFSMLRRFLDRRSMFAPDRRHFHHRLVDLGLKQHHVVITIYITTLLAAGLGMFMMVARNSNSLVIFFCILLLLLLVFHLVGSVRLREVITGLKQKYVIIHQVQDEIKSFEDAELYFRRVTTFYEWWQAVSTAADVMDFLNLSLPLTNRDGSNRTLTWRQDGQAPKSNHYEVLKVNVPVRDRRAGPGLNLEIEVCRDGSLESAGRRVALFTRLIEEYDIASLPVNERVQQLSESKETVAK